MFMERTCIPKIRSYDELKKNLQTKTREMILQSSAFDSFIPHIARTILRYTMICTNKHFSYIHMTLLTNYFDLELKDCEQLI